MLLDAGFSAEGFRNHGGRIMVPVTGKIADRHLGVGNRCLDHRFDIAGVHRHPSRSPSVGTSVTRARATVSDKFSADGLSGHVPPHYIPQTFVAKPIIASCDHTRL